MLYAKALDSKIRSHDWFICADLDLKRDQIIFRYATTTAQPFQNSSNKRKEFETNNRAWIEKRLGCQLEDLDWSHDPDYGEGVEYEADQDL